MFVRSGSELVQTAASRQVGICQFGIRPGTDHNSGACRVRVGPRDQRQKGRYTRFVRKPIEQGISIRSEAIAQKL
jgi:hypothetical protein